MRILSCDIGNSSIKFGLYSEGKLLDYSRISHEEFSHAFLAKMDFEFAAISSVVPAVTDKLTELLETQFRITPLIISKSSEFSLEINYETPETLGIDRICGAEGALFLYNKENDSNKLRQDELVLTVDCGTATTINVIKSPGIFSGGVIAPGLTTMMNSLNSGTAQLPKVDLFSYNQLIGSNTESCIVSGIINATLGLLERTIAELTKDNKNVITYLTGGNSDIIAQHFEKEFFHVKDLVLLGIYSLAKNYLEKNK